MYLEPQAKMQVGNLTFTNFNKITIEESVKELGGKATVTLPRGYALLNGKSVLDLIRSGDPVTIWLGYDGVLEEEFSGFVRQVEGGAPLVLHLDDGLYPLKRTNYCHSWPAVTLRAVLQHVAPGYSIQCPDINLGKFQVPNMSAFRVLMDIQQKFGLIAIVRGRSITCQFPYDMRGTGATHTYTFYTPTVKNGNNLKYQRAEDCKVLVRVTSTQRNGKKLKAEAGARANGENGAVYEASIPGLSQSEVQTYADKWYKSLCFDGYTGSITGFGTPRTKAGDTLVIKDKEEPDRAGSYLVEAVTINYDLAQGFERENKLSYKV